MYWQQYVRLAGLETARRYGCGERHEDGVRAASQAIVATSVDGSVDEHAGLVWFGLVGFVVVCLSAVLCVCVCVVV